MGKSRKDSNFFKDKFVDKKKRVENKKSYTQPNKEGKYKKDYSIFSEEEPELTEEENEQEIH